MIIELLHPVNDYYMPALVWRTRGGSGWHLRISL